MTLKQTLRWLPAAGIRGRVSWAMKITRHPVPADGAHAPPLNRGVSRISTVKPDPADSGN